MSGERAPRLRRRALLRLAIAPLLLGATALLLVFEVVPWLGRRGDLNPIIESIIRSSLKLPVSIGALETEPLSELAVTRVKSVSAAAPGRFSFRCDRLSVFYRPLGLWSGAVEELVFARPELFLDLDADLEEIFDVPRLPPPPREQPAPAEAGFRIGHFSIQDGSLALGYGGRQIPVSGLQLDVFGIGGRENLIFELRAVAFGARLEARGRLLLDRPAGDPPRYRVEGAKATVRGLDLEPLLEVFGPHLAGWKGRGRLDLDAAIEGIWPERVEVRVETAVREAGADREGGGAAPALDQGAISLSASAAVLGEADAVEFSIDLSGEGRLTARGRSGRDRAAIHLEGLFDKRAEAGGKLTIRAPSRIETELAGIAITGAVRSVLEAPRWEIDLALQGLDLEALREHPAGNALPAAEPPGWKTRGVLDLQARLRGPIDHPRIGGRFSLKRAGIVIGDGPELGGEVEGEVDSIAGILDEGTPRLEGAEIRCRGLDLAVLARLSGIDPETLSLGGRLSVRLEAPVLDLTGSLPRSGAEALEAQIQGEAISLAIAGGFLALEKGALDGTIRIEAPAAAPPQPARIRFDLGLRAPALAVGSAIEMLEGEEIALEGSLALEPGGGGEPAAAAGRILFDAALGLPSAGVVRLAGTASPEAGLDLEAAAGEVPLRRFLGIYLRDAFVERFPWLRGAEFTGSSRLEMALRGQPGALEVSGRLRTLDAGAVFPALDLELPQVEVDLPFRLGAGRAAEEAPPQRGRVLIGKLRLGGGGIERLELPVILDSGGYRLGGAAEFGLFGGAASLRELEMGILPAGVPLRASLRVDGIDLRPLAALAGLGEVDGRLDADFTSISVQGDRLALDGFLKVKAFGGEIVLTDLGVDHFAAPYLSVRMRSGTVRDLNLQRLGEALNFGLISGVLQGRIEDLVFGLDGVSSFRIDVETVRRPGVPQYINKNAIASIRRLFLGPFAAAEDLFFSKFRYREFGFTASLANRRLRLRGKRVIGGIEYLMLSRWWQLPRIDIINSRPGRDYDWRAIQRNLRSILRRKTDAPTDGK